jgi:hypothetical protein
VHRRQSGGGPDGHGRAQVVLRGGGQPAGLHQERSAAEVLLCLKKYLAETILPVTVFAEAIQNNVYNLLRLRL